ncbi:S-layer homology domain-containing protein [Sporosarcina koreensis]|uniref:S-layer homology domain-containing protein n=1 Tax=Sporosarcina koreensis TaxID=334735 RepID=A0ABW0TYR1_9BACL
MRNFKNNLLMFVLLCSVFVIMPGQVNASPPDYNGGVLNENTYEEVFFLESYPITFKGKPTVTERQSKDKITTTYRHNLTSANGDKLVRNVVYETTLNNREDKGQTASQTIVKSYSEKITTATKAVYTLEDFQFSQATIIDNPPASDFYSGDLVGTKIYKVTRPQVPGINETITVSMTGRNMGYKNFWGATETQIINYEISSNFSSGTTFVTSKVSDSKTKTLEYQPHDPSLSSFTGGHIIVSNANMVGEYTYSYPYYLRTGSIKLSQQNTPTLERLIVPKFRDLNNHWAKDSIEKLYSIGVLDESTQFFSPNKPMTRYNFTIGVLKAVDTRVFETKTKNSSAKSIFKDVSRNDKGYPYIESAVNQGIINGYTADLFKPAESLTRAQAVAILVRALGMEGRAPGSGYRTNFADDRSIPLWAKDSAYVANELGLVHGNARNEFNAQQKLTRAEAAALLQRFVDFLENDLQKNYRDDILNSN